jgi:hypothetical protein
MRLIKNGKKIRNEREATKMNSVSFGQLSMILAFQHFLICSCVHKLVQISNIDRF